MTKTNKFFSSFPYLYIFLQIRNQGIKNTLINLKAFYLIKKQKQHFFDAKFYLKKNPQISKSGMDPLLHYMFHGYNENKNPNSKFNTKYYLKKYKDVKKMGLNPLVHYVSYGQYESREIAKGLKNIDLDENTIKRHCNLILKSGEFDEEWYLKKYPEAEKIAMNPIMHYVRIGNRKYYDPNPHFDSKKYLKYSLSEIDYHINPFVHYLSSGKEENRQAEFTLEESIYGFIYHTVSKKKVFKFFKRVLPVLNQVLFFSEIVEAGKEDSLPENGAILYDNLKARKLVVRKKRLEKDKVKLYFKILLSKVIVIDSGFDYLEHFKLRENQKVVQIWHACGAFKKIAYDVKIYGKHTLEGFKKQFPQYDDFIVSSKNIVDIYASAHRINRSVVKALGVPRTDLILDENHKNTVLDKFYRENPDLKDKNIVLYCPTLRDTRKFDPKIDWEMLNDNLSDDDVFIIKRHFTMKYDILNSNSADSKNIYIYSKIKYLDDEATSTLMLASKLLITDYSSVIFEYSLLNKPVIHYCPDYETYINERDFYLKFPDDLYGEFVTDSTDLIKLMKDTLKNGKDLDTEKMKKFKEEYMEACDGNSAKRVVNLINSYLK